MTDAGRETTKRQPRGQALVTMALALMVLMGFGALAIDVGMMFLARNELQNAADAAALAGVQEFYYTGCMDCPQSRWTRAEDSARANIAINKSMKATLTTGTITSGWWNITGTPSGMQAKTKSPVVFGDAAALRVTIRKAPGSNGGSASRRSISSPKAAGDRVRLGGLSTLPPDARRSARSRFLSDRA